jgi:hypothetical protein
MNFESTEDEVRDETREGERASECFSIYKQASFTLVPLEF